MGLVIRRLGSGGLLAYIRDAHNESFTDHELQTMGSDMKVLYVLGILVGVLLVLTVGVLVFVAPPTSPRGARANEPYLTVDAVVLSDGARLPLRTWGVMVGDTPRAIVVAVHGVAGYSKVMEPLGIALAKRGIATYTYDQRGHGGAPNRGTWAGIDSLVVDLNEVVTLVRARHSGVPIYLAGHSLGGAILLNAAAMDRYPSVNGTILIAPAVNVGRHVAPPLRAVLSLGARIAPRAVIARPAGSEAGLSDNPAYADLIQHDPLMLKNLSLSYLYGSGAATDTAMAGADHLKTPTLELYGEHDISVPVEELTELGRRLTAPKRVIRYQNGYHVLLWDRQREQVFSDIDAWISEDMQLHARHE
jgi:acylglycerol lipase